MKPKVTWCAEQWLTCSAYTQRANLCNASTQTEARVPTGGDRASSDWLCDQSRERERERDRERESEHCRGCVAGLLL